MEMHTKSGRRGAAMGAAFLLAVMLMVPGPAVVSATEASAFAGASQTTRLDLSDGRVAGLSRDYEFLVPKLWTAHIIAERDMAGNPSYVLDRINFMCLAASGNSKPQRLMTLYVIDKAKWKDSLPYTPVLITKDYVFTVTMGAWETVFTNEFDRAVFQACREEVKTIELIREKIKVSSNQILPNILTAFVNDKPLEQPVVFMDGTHYLPLRNVCEALGYAVTWSGSTNTATIRKGSFSDVIPVRANMVSDSRGYKMRMIEGRVYVSAAYFYNVYRFIIETDEAKNVYVIAADR